MRFYRALSPDPLGATGDGGLDVDLGPCQRAFAAIYAHPAHLLVAATSDHDTPNGTLQLSFLRGHGTARSIARSDRGRTDRLGRSRRGPGSALFR